MNRREALKNIAAAGVLAAIPAPLLTRAAARTRSSIAALVGYLESHARPDGGYAWEDQAASHLTPTFGVIGCYHLLGRTPPRRAQLGEFIRTHHPSHLKKLEQERRMFEFQQVQSLVWLGFDAAEFRDKVRAWKKPLAYLRQYEQDGHPVFQSELGAFTCRALLNLPLNDLSPEFIEYLDIRRRANGSFNNTPAADGSDGHVMNTWWGLEALRVLGRAEAGKDPTIAWLRACQLANGGFTFQPKPEFAGVDDVAYTRAAVRALHLLGAAPLEPDACIRYLHSLRNADGGFGDRPGWLSNPLATCCALEALDALGALEAFDSTPLARGQPAIRRAPPSRLKLFTIQLEAPGKGSPADAVELARHLHIHLWGAKNAAPGWIARAQRIADRRKVPVKFFVSNEEYGTWVNVPGLGTYSHTSDIIAPAGVDFGGSQANSGVVSWPEFREQRLAPLVQAAGRLIWQFGENEELARIYLDDSLERGGYAAISTFHFGNPDFTNTEPFLKRYRGRIPFVALQDAHGNEPWWWSDKLAGFRTVFAAAEPTWQAWLDALRNDWVAAVRHDALSGYKTWVHTGVAGMGKLLRERELEWRWWGESPEQIQRPPATIAFLEANAEFEQGAPKSGAALRVRCWWEATAQGLPKRQLAQLVELTVDGRRIPVEEISPRNSQGNRTDHYYMAALPQVSSGKHTAVATVRLLENGRNVRVHAEWML